jgi:acyl transferase domain-containing protein
VFRARIDACDRILAPQLGAALTELMMYGDDPDAIHQTHVTQPALVAIELALADLWTSRGVTASAVIGHSFGEIAAAIHAGVMELEAGLALVAHRARLMQSTAPGAMLAVSAPLAHVTAWLAGTELDVAAVNGPASVVVSGERGAVEALAARLTARGVTVRPLRVSRGSHSRMMAPVLDELHAAIAGLRYGAPRLPIVANLTGRLADAGTYDASYWCRHLREPVQFFEGVQALRALDVDVCLEIGPSPTLISLVDAAGLLPRGGGVPSLRRGAGERASLDAAAELLRTHGTRPPHDRHEPAGCAGERGIP